MFLRHKIRRKDGKEHRYWSIVENRRVSGGRVVQRQVLYLGEINDSQRAAWCRAIEAFDEGGRQASAACAVSGRSGGAGHSKAMWCRCGSSGWSCIARANGARAGWPDL